ncbi:alpha/beta fold hydrolase [Hyalangium rubrum]|uniref:Alpha/beta fold hydrolase n=1 Tax=Hyalangium rubrum TaxID=3103134 RepID=A0ABU5GXL1_9BACT|nr:alpha/beta fold hydrolase [Hyalangium sp. s54d21]MDY7225434.1 alpha/beta fold hydrolase [Hyalangium sp. s54d21]
MPHLSRDGFELSYDVEGQGPPVLMIQGVGVIGEGWRPQVRALSQDFQVLCFDNRGLGKSGSGKGPLSIEAMAEDARALMDAMGWKSAHVMGHSMGGLIAQQLALDCPERVRSLSLMCTFARGRDGARVTPRILWMGLRTRIGTRGMRRRSLLQMLMSKAYLRSTPVDALADRMAPLMGRDLSENPPILMQQLQAMSRHHALERLGALARIPTLVVSAEEDPIALPAFGKQLAAAIPGARYVEIPDASHAVTIQKDGEINALLRRFLDETEKSLTPAG